MDNEEKILEILTQMQIEQKKVIERLDNLEVNQAQMREEQASMREEQAQMREEMNERFDSLEANMKYAWQDIAFVDKRIKQHEKEFHNVG